MFAFSKRYGLIDGSLLSRGGLLDNVLPLHDHLLQGCRNLMFDVWCHRCWDRFLLRLKRYGLLYGGRLVHLI